MAARAKDVRRKVSRLSGLAWAAAGLVLAPSPSLAQAPAAPDAERIRLLAGQEAPLCPNGGCHSPICDDPRVATITANSGVIQAHEPGVTLCSLDYAYGLRQVFRVTVIARPPPPPPDGLEETPGAAPPPVRPPPAPPPEAASREAAPRPPPRATDDETLYQWTAEDGSLQFGHLDDIPPAQRRAARPVTAELSVVPAGSVSRPASGPPPPPTSPPPAPQAVPAPEPLPDGIDGR